MPLSLTEARATAVQAEGHRVENFSVAGDPQQLGTGDAPEPEGAVGAGRSQQIGLGAESYAVDLLVVIEGQELGPGSVVPQLDRRVRARRCQAVAAAIECDGEDASVVTEQRPLLLSGNGIPESGRPVVAAAR